MSFDVSLHGKKTSVDVGNHTSNTSAFWHEVITVWSFNDEEGEEQTETGLKALHGMKGKDVALALEVAVRNVHTLMHEEGDIKLSRFDAKNGWGSALSAFLFMVEIMVACKNHPKNTLWVWS